MATQNREILELRHIILEKRKKLQIAQEVSWKIKQIEDLYSPKSSDPEVLSILSEEYDKIIVMLNWWADDEFEVVKLINENNKLKSQLVEKGGSEDGE